MTDGDFSSIVVPLHVLKEIKHRAKDNHTSVHSKISELIQLLQRPLNELPRRQMGSKILPISLSMLLVAIQKLQLMGNWALQVANTHLEAIQLVSIHQP